MITVAVKLTTKDKRLGHVCDGQDINKSRKYRTLKKALDSARRLIASGKRLAWIEKSTF